MEYSIIKAECEKYSTRIHNIVSPAEHCYGSESSYVRDQHVLNTNCETF